MEIFDLAIIGAGSAGCGVAVEACKQGLKVCIIESKDDIFKKTSSASMRIIHSGFRHLARGDLLSAIRQIKEAEALKNHYSSVIKKAQVALPLNSLKVSPLVLKAGCLLYNTARNLVESKDKKKVFYKFSTVANKLNTNIPKPFFKLFKDGALVWEDSLINSLSKLRA
ncbi:MAG: FAD-dependent oxidoreductase, partial [Candidatus Dadabacteria bacterium]